MQFIASLVALLGLTLSASALDNGQARAAKNQGAVNAIGRFCQNQGIVVPSAYAAQGMYSPDMHTEITISGECKPGQWVPQQYCFSQFYDMCAHGGHHGGSKRRYGNNGCQHWQIDFDKHRIM